MLHTQTLQRPRIRAHHQPQPPVQGVWTPYVRPSLRHDQTTSRQTQTREDAGTTGGTTENRNPGTTASASDALPSLQRGGSRQKISPSDGKSPHNDTGTGLFRLQLKTDDDHSYQNGARVMSRVHFKSVACMTWGSTVIQTNFMPLLLEVYSV